MLKLFIESLTRYINLDMLTPSFYYVDGPTLPNFNYYDYVGDEKVIADEFLMQNTWVMRNDGQVTVYPIEVAFDAYKEQYGIDTDIAFNEMKKLSDVITRSFIVAFVGKVFNNTYKNGYIHKHFHAPPTDENNVYASPGYRRTITAVIPTKIVDPVTEQVCLQQFDYDFVGKTPIYNSYQNREWQEQNLDISTDIAKIKLPNPGQYLILDFTSSHTLHWIENNFNTRNEFICLVQDI